VADEQLQYMVIGGLCASASVIPLLVCVFGTWPQAQRSAIALRLRPKRCLTCRFCTIAVAFSNRAFLYVVGIYLFAWLALQITASIIPFYAVFWMGLDSYFLPALLVQGTAILMMFVCNLISRRIGKKKLFFLGMGVWLVAQIGLFFLQPGQRFGRYTASASWPALGWPPPMWCPGRCCPM
jgi:GPH family glycoside/pentoside/hexuronide:cation symporter